MWYKRFFTLAFIVLSVGMIGCAGQQAPGDSFEGANLNAPDWYLSPPTKDGSMMVAASGKSRRMNVALEKASLSAKRDLAANIRSTLEGQRDRYVEEIGDSANADETVTREQYQDFTRAMVAEELQGVQTVEKTVVENENGYRAYVLVELTMDDLRDKLSQQEELKTRFNAKQFEQDMENNLQELREQRPNS